MLLNKVSLFPLYVFVIELPFLVSPLKLPLSTFPHNAYFAFPSTVNKPKWFSEPFGLFCESFQGSSNASK